MLRGKNPVDIQLVLLNFIPRFSVSQSIDLEDARRDSRGDEEAQSWHKEGIKITLGSPSAFGDEAKVGRTIP